MQKNSYRDFKMDEKLKHGTTTVGIVCKEGIVLAADKRTSAGTLIADRNTKKVQQISDHMAITTAGLVSDAQLFTKIIKAQLALLSIRKGKEPTVKEAVNLLASMSYNNIRQPSMVPGIVGFLLGGYDREGIHLYELGIDGSITESTDYRTDGSGSIIALGVLETLYKKDCTIEEGVKLALKTISAALRRDTATGDGIDVIVVSADGVKTVISKELDFKLD